MVSTTEEIKLHLPANATFDMDDIRPFILNMAVPEVLLPVLGEEAYTEMQTAYQNNSLTAEQEKLLPLAQYAIVNYAYAKYIPSAQVSISANGIHIEVSENKKTAFAWQIEQLQNSFLEAADNGIEQLYLFLEKNIADYATWAASDRVSILRANFINTATDFNAHYNIGNSRRTFLALLPLMRIAEETDVLTLLGAEFYDEIKVHIAQNTVPDKSKLLINYLQKAIAHLAMVQAIAALDVYITANGTRIGSLKISSEKTQTDLQRLSSHETHCRNTANTYLAKAKKFIYDNIADFPTFESSSTYVDPNTDTSWDQSDNSIVLF